MTYEEYTNKRQKEFDALPIFYALTRDQLDKELAQRNATIHDIYRLGTMGNFYLKKDSPVIKAWVEKAGELTELMKDHAFAVDAFLYEMNNHEYAINWQGDWEVCRIFCDKDCEFGEDKTYIEYLNEDGKGYLVSAYSEAKEQHMILAAEWRMV